jgi:tetratricopeptide (TPR) repeat protein
MKAWHSEHQEALRLAAKSNNSSTAISKASQEAQRISDQAIAAERQCRPDLAAEILEKLSILHPHAETLARLSKQYTDMSYLMLQIDSSARPRTVELNTKAVELAMKAVATDPTNALGHIALCVSRGRLALVSDNRKKIQLANDAAADAATALRLDPHNDYAHHLMGRWHYEMAQLNAVVRTLIRICYGTALMEGSFSEALTCYRTAAELNPGRVIHRVEIGRTLIKLGEVQAGVEHLKHALDMDIEDINAKLQQDDAAMLLKKLQAGRKEGLYIKNEQRN